MQNNANKPVGVAQVQVALFSETAEWYCSVLYYCEVQCNNHITVQFEPRNIYHDSLFTLDNNSNNNNFTKQYRNRHNLIKLIKIFKGLSRIRIDKLFMLNENTKGFSGHCLKLKKTRCTRDIIWGFLSNNGTCCISGQSMHLHCKNSLSRI